jgi:hypothetical protein
MNPELQVTFNISPKYIFGELLSCFQTLPANCEEFETCAFEMFKIDDAGHSTGRHEMEGAKLQFGKHDVDSELEAVEE